MEFRSVWSSVSAEYTSVEAESLCFLLESHTLIAYDGHLPSSLSNANCMILHTGAASNVSKDQDLNRGWRTVRALRTSYIPGREY